MGKQGLLWLIALVGVATLTGCAAPSPTATPTSLPAAVVATPTKAPTATPTKRPITKMSAASSSASLAYIPVWTAKAKGFFEEEGLDFDWTLTGSGAKATAAAIGRSADIAMSAAPDVVAAVAQAQPLQTFAVVSVTQFSDLTIRPDAAERKGITEKSSLEDKVKALKGLKVGATSPGSGTDSAVRYLLAKYNIDPERDLEIVYIAAASLPAALRQGAVDVMTLSPPDGSVAETEGFGKILISFTRGDVPETNDTLYIVPSSHRDNIQSKPEILEAFVRAVWRGMRLAKEKPDDARDAVQKAGFPEIDPAVFRKVWEATYSAFPSSPEITAKALQSTVDYRNKTTKESPLQVKLEDYYTPKVVEAAKKQLGY